MQTTIEFLWFDNTIFGGCGQAFPDSQTNFKTLRRVISQKGVDGLPRFFTGLESFIKAV